MAYFVRSLGVRAEGLGLGFRVEEFPITSSRTESVQASNNPVHLYVGIPGLVGFRV